jgi:glutaminyl-peptide cyclotransferase
VVALGLLLGGCGSTASSAESEQTFSGKRAFALVRMQVEAGQRPAGSPQLQKLADELVGMLPNGHLEPIPGEPDLHNVVGSIPGSQPAIVIGAHYDTLAKPKGFVGANNGAAGTAIVIGAAHTLEAHPPKEGREIVFALFDGEEPPEGLPEESANFESEGLRGSRAYVKAHPHGTAAMILLDYVGNKGLVLPREGYSNPELWEQTLAAARKVGASKVFRNCTALPITDDHVPFLQSGVQAMDLIDWSYPGHSLKDSLSRISARSLQDVGRTVVQLATELSEQTAKPSKPSTRVIERC